MSGQITPEPTPRLVIPYGDRPIINVRTGNATLDMYQWMQRVNRGLGISITNIDTTVNQVNTNTTEITEITTDVTGIETELADIEAELQALVYWVGQATSSIVPPAPPPPPPPAALANPPPPQPPLSPAVIALLAAIPPPAPPPINAQANITQRSAIASGAAVALTTATPANVTSLSLPPGMWQLTASVYFKAAATTTLTSVAGSFSATSATMGTDPGSFGNQYLAGVTGSTIGQDVAVTGMTDVVTIGATTYFLVADATFGVSTLSAYGLLVAIPIAQ